MALDDDAQLVARVVVLDDRHAFSTLARRYQSPVRAFLRRLCAGDDAAADDLAQDVFLAAYQKLDTFRAEASLKSWLFSIAYRKFVSEGRRAHRAQEQPMAHMPLAEAPTRASASIHDVDRAMAALREEERAALSLCYQWGLTHDEAARVLEVPAGTVKSLILRGKQKLREPLAAYAPPAAPPVEVGGPRVDTRKGAVR